MKYISCLVTSFQFSKFFFMCSMDSFFWAWCIVPFHCTKFFHTFNVIGEVCKSHHIFPSISLLIYVKPRWYYKSMVTPVFWSNDLWNCYWSNKKTLWNCLYAIFLYLFFNIKVLKQEHFWNICLKKLNSHSKWVKSVLQGFKHGLKSGLPGLLDSKSLFKSVLALFWPVFAFFFFYSNPLFLSIDIFNLDPHHELFGQYFS